MTSSARARIEGGIRDGKLRSVSLSETVVVDAPIANVDDGDIKLIVTRAASEALAAMPRRERPALLDKAEARHHLRRIRRPRRCAGSPT